MYEKYSFESILEEMINRVVEKNGEVDTREGSVIYDALAPAAFEIMNLYMEMNGIMNETFADSASREYLIRRCAERGIAPYPATKAILKGEFNIAVPVGSRFSLDDLNYKVIDKITDTTYKLECESTGTIGNAYFGEIIPIQYIEGLERAEINELLIPGEDEEDTEDLRKRYFQTFEISVFGGNKKDYIEKTNSIAGVGATKVEPVWDGGGTVLLTIIDSRFAKASDALVDEVKRVIDPMPYGTGSGIAPIGHVVTVQTVENVEINITTEIIFDSAFTYAQLQESCVALIDEYLLSLRKTWATSKTLTVRISQIETRLLSLEGIIDISNTRINERAENLELSEYQIPILGYIKNES